MEHWSKKQIRLNGGQFGSEKKLGKLWRAKKDIRSKKAVDAVKPDILDIEVNFKGRRISIH